MDKEEYYKERLDYEALEDAKNIMYFEFLDANMDWLQDEFFIGLTPDIDTPKTDDPDEYEAYLERHNDDFDLFCRDKFEEYLDDEMREY
jgi:hypothetical protein